MEKFRDVDSGWAWVVMVACFVANMLVGFLNYSAGIFHVAFLEYYQQDVASTAVVGSVFTSLYCLMGPFASMVVNMTSCRLALTVGAIMMAAGFTFSFFASDLSILLLTYGVIAGVGSGFCCTPILITTGYSFQRYRGIANGIVVSGAGFGMLASGPISQLFIDSYGLHGAFLMMAGVGCQLVLCAALMRPSGAEKWHKQMRQEAEDASKKCVQLRSIFDLSIYKNYAFLLIVVAGLLWNAAYAIVLLHLPNFSVVQGSSKTSAAMLIFIIGVGSSASRILSGLTTSPDSGIDPILLKVGVLGITGVITLLFPFYSALYWQQVIFSVLFGIYSGGLIAYTVPILIEIVGLSKLSASLGALYFTAGIGWFIGPSVAGLVIDKTDSYDIVFYIAGATFTLGSILTLMSTIWRPKDPNEDEEDKIVASVLFKGSNFLTGSALLTGSTNLKLDFRASTMNMYNSTKSIGHFTSNKSVWTQSSNRSVNSPDKTPKISRLAINNGEVIPLTIDTDKES